MDLAKEMESLMRETDNFTRDNFGLQMGSDYPETVRELLKSERVCMKLALSFIAEMVQGRDALNPEEGPAEMGRNPAVFRRPMEFLYWGIQLGRRMEREQAQVLDKVAAAEGK